MFNCKFLIVIAVTIYGCKCTTIYTESQEKADNLFTIKGVVDKADFSQENDILSMEVNFNKRSNMTLKNIGITASFEKNENLKLTKSYAGVYYFELVKDWKRFAILNVQINYTADSSGQVVNDDLKVQLYREKKCRSNLVLH